MDISMQGPAAAATLTQSAAKINDPAGGESIRL
jgi:hypothetical protein